MECTSYYILNWHPRRYTLVLSSPNRMAAAEAASARLKAEEQSDDEEDSFRNPRLGVRELCVLRMRNCNALFRSCVP